MYLGNKFTDTQINEMLDDKKQIRYDSDSYKEFDKSIKYCLGSYYINKTGDNNENIIPLLSEFAGKDKQGGVAKFTLTRHLSEKYKGKFPIDLVYMRYGEHSLMDYQTENGKQAMRDLHTKILEFATKYFK